MRYLILSDLHSNLEALRAVLKDARARGFGSVLCLGDIVGYGANPNEVVDLLRSLKPEAVIRGNHDKVASGIEEGEDFSDVALEAALWTREALTAGNRSYLEDLPQGPVDAGGFLISHGTPLHEDDYLLSDEDADFVFDSAEFPLAFFGHSHYACAFHRSDEDPSQLQMLEGEERRLSLKKPSRYLVNPGSTGQPRDHDPRSSYAIYNRKTRSVQVHRVAYDIHAAQHRIQSEGLPEELAQRLEYGI